MLSQTTTHHRHSLFAKIANAQHRRTQRTPVAPTARVDQTVRLQSVVKRPDGQITATLWRHPEQIVARCPDPSIARFVGEMLDASLISVSSSTEVATAVLIGWEPATEIHGQSAPAACNTTPLPYLKLANPEWTPKAQDLAMLITMVDSLSAPFANLLHACLANDTDMKAFLAVPGSCHHHHAFRGGLLAHTIEVMLLVERMCEAMKGADRDVAIAAAMLHDIGKCREYTINRLDMSRRTKQGKLLVHRQIGYAMLLDALKRCPIEAHMSLELQHCLVAADGPNYMSLPRKQTIEAHILQAADGVSASAKSEDRR